MARLSKGTQPARRTGRAPAPSPLPRAGTAGPGRVRTRRALAAVLAGIVLVLAGGVGPAQADESPWVNYGGDARAYSAVYSVGIGGSTYDVTRGDDENIWFRYNSGGWQPLGGDNAARTPSPPRIVEFPPGRAMAIHRGTDNELWYSQVNNGAANSWTPWTRLPAGANAIGSPLLTVQPSGNLFIDVPNANRVLSTNVLFNFGGVISAGAWRVDDHAILGTNATDIEGDSQIAVYGTEYYRSVYRNFITGSDHHVWRETIDASDNTVLGVEQVGGGAECTTGVGAAHLGDQTTVLTPGQPGFYTQQRVLISCVGDDGYVWESTSFDGGYTFDGWRHPSGTLAPSLSTPAVFPSSWSNTSWTIDIRWNGQASSAFPDNSVVGKSVI